MPDREVVEKTATKMSSQATDYRRKHSARDDNQFEEATQPAKKRERIDDAGIRAKESVDILVAELQTAHKTVRVKEELICDLAGMIQELDERLGHMEWETSFRLIGHERRLEELERQLEKERAKNEKYEDAAKRVTAIHGHLGGLVDFMVPKHGNDDSTSQGSSRTQG